MAEGRSLEVSFHSLRCFFFRSLCKREIEQRAEHYDVTQSWPWVRSLHKTQELHEWLQTLLTLSSSPTSNITYLFDVTSPDSVVPVAGSDGA